MTGGTRVALDTNSVPEGLPANCTFGTKRVAARRIGKNKYECLSPPADEAGPVNLTISYGKDRSFISPPVEFLYYEKVHVTSLEPSCGPI